MSQGFTGKNFTFQRWDGLYHPTKNLSLSMSTFTTTYNWATGTSTNNLISLTTDASANGTGALLFVGTGASSTVLPLLVKSGTTTALTVNTSAQVLIGTLSSGRITYAGASGLLQDSANMTFDGNRIALATTGNTGGLLIGGDANLYRSSANVLTTDDAFIANSVFAYNDIISEGGYVSSGQGGGGSLGQFLLLGDSSGTITIQPQSAAGTYNFNLPITAGTSGHVLTSGGGGATAMTWTDPSSLAVRWNSIVAPNGNQSLTMSTHTTTWNWATGTSTNNLFNLTTDASANGTGALLRIATGASATVVPMLVVAAGTTALTVNASAQVLVNSLTSGRVTYAGTSGLLQDSANMTFDGNRLALATTGNTGGVLIGGDTQLYRNAADVLRTPDTFVADSGGLFGTTSNDARLTVYGAGNTSGTNAAIFKNSDGTNMLVVRNDRKVSIGGDPYVNSKFQVLANNNNGDIQAIAAFHELKAASTGTFPRGFAGDVFIDAGAGAHDAVWGGYAGITIETGQTGAIAQAFGHECVVVYKAVGGSATYLEGGVYSVRISDAAATGTITNCIALDVNTNHVTTSAAAVTSNTGLLLAQAVPAGGITTSYGIRILTPTTGAGTIGTHYAIFIANQSVGTSKYAIYFDGSSGSSYQGIWWNADTNLYRSAAGTLKTDNSLVVATNLTVSTMTSGSLLFAGTSGLVSQDNANLFWDNTNNTLGVGTTRTGAISGTNPSVRILGTGTSSATSSFEVRDSSNGILFFVRNDRQIGIGTNTPAAAFQIDASISTIAMFGSGGVNNVTISVANPLHSGSAGSLITGTGEETGGLQITGDVGISLNTTTGGSVSVWHNGSQRINMSNTAATLYPHGISAGNTYELSFLELVANGSNYLSFKAPDNIGTTVTHTLPSDVPAAGEFLKVTSYSAGAAVLEWSTATATVSIGGTVTSGTTGSVLFVGAGPVLAQDNANFFWDDTNNTFGIGTTRTGAISATNPSVRILGTGITSATSSFEVQDSGPNTLLFVRNDGRIGIGSNAPSSKLYVAGNVDLAAWGFAGAGLQLVAATYTDNSTAGSGTATNAAIHSIAQPTLAATNATVTTTNAATLYIAGSPANGTNMTITNPYALWIGAGATKYDAASALTSGTFTHEVSALTFTGGAGSAAMVGKSYVLTLSPSGAQTGSATGAYTEVAFGTSQSWSTGALVGHKVLMNMSGAGSTTVASVYSGQFIYQKTGANTLTNAYGLLVQQSGTHAGTTTTYNGLRIEKNYSAGTITTSYGIYLQQVGNLGAGTTNGASIFMESDGTAKTGLVWGTSSPGDTNLYRSAADTLRTDDAFIAIGGVTAGTLTSTRVVFAGASGLLSDSANFTYTTGTGQMTLATTGSAAGLLIGGDAQLYRDAADVLRTPDSLRIDGSVGINVAAPATTSGRLSVTGSNTSLSADYNNITSNMTHTVNNPDTTTGRSWALRFSATQAGSGIFNDGSSLGATGVEGLAEFTGSGSSVGVTGVISLARNTSTGTLTRATGFLASMSNVNTGGGHITNLRPVDIAWATDFSTTNQVRCAIRIGVGPTNAGSHGGSIVGGIYFNSSSRGVQDGIIWGTGGDTNLYSSATDTLKTDDSFVVGTNLTVSTLTATRVHFSGTAGLFTDSANFTYTTGTGQLALATTGSGAGILIGGDTQLYRRAADIMSMAASDSFEVPSGFVGIGTTAPTSATRVNITYNATVGSGTERSVLFTGAVSAAHTGFYNITQSEGSTTNSTGTVNWIAGALNRIRGNSTGGTVTSIYGLHNMAWLDSASGTMTYSNNTGVQCEALWSNTAFTGTATVGSNIALNASNVHVTLAGGGTVNITNEYGLNIQASVNTGIVITTRYGIRVNDPTGSTGTLTTQYGLYFEDLDRAGTNYGLYFAGTSGLSRQGIWWNADTNLYRSAADTLRTDDAFISGSTITGASSLTLGANGGTIGSILLRGNTSGTVTVIPAAAAGTWTFTLPTTGGTSGYVLQTNGSGTTTWAAPGVAWTEVTGTSTTAVAHNGYVANNAAQVVITLPTPAIGSVVEIVGLGAGGWRALCASGHTIRLGTIVSASTGYAESTNRYDSIRIVGISATAWSIVSVVGTLDVV